MPEEKHGIAHQPFGRFLLLVFGDHNFGLSPKRCLIRREGADQLGDLLTVAETLLGSIGQVRHAGEEAAGLICPWRDGVGVDQLSKFE